MSGKTAPHRVLLAALLALVVLGSAACGDSSVIVRLGPPGSTVHPPTSVPPTNIATPSSALRAPTASGTTSTNPMITVDPSGPLADGQQVHVDGTGFTPGESLQAIECADKGERTGPGDCDLVSARSTRADSTGSVSVDLKVHRGPFGINRIVCGQPVGCLVSVTQASLSPTEEADTPLIFR